MMKISKINVNNFLDNFSLTCDKNLSKLLNSIKNELVKNNVVILSNLNLIDFDEKGLKSFFLKFSSNLGTLVEHNEGKKDYIWEIKTQTKIKSVPTFSEHNYKAELHTDSQYRLLPEKFISLMAIKTANCGGGSSILLDFESILKNLTQSKRGDLCLSLLEKERFPFLVPSVFSNYENQLIYAPIISDNPNIRFRYDTLKKGLEIVNKKNDKLLWAVEFLNEVISNHKNRKIFMLKKNEIIFINNHNSLHGRTSFNDLERFLLRVRFNV